MKLTSVFANQHYYGAAVFARFAVSIATLIWCAIVISGAGTMDPRIFPIYADMISIMPAWAWAELGLAVSALHITMLIIKCRPIPLGIVGYAFMLLFWGYLSLAIFFTVRPVPPAAGAAITVVALIAAYAFAVNPKRHATDPQ